MNRRHFITSSGGLALVSLAGPTASAATPKPRLCTKGELLHDLTIKDLETDGWRKGRGEWKIDKGAATGRKVDPEPLYFASIIKSLKLPADFIMEGELRHDGANSSWISFHGSGALVFRNDRIAFHEDQSELTSEGVPSQKHPMKKGKWEPFVIERLGTMMAAEYDGVELGTEHQPLNGEITSIHYVVASNPESTNLTASIRGVKIYAATANPKWKMPKARK